MEGVGLSPSGCRRELGLAWALALLVRGISAARAESLWPDGVIELEQAAAFAAGDWRQGIAPGFHPLYSLLVAGLAALGAPLLIAAQVVAVSLSALVAPLSAASAVRLLPAEAGPARARQVALAAGAIAALLPLLARLGGQVLAYGPAHAALAGALCAALGVASRSGSPPARELPWSLGAGAAVGLGYLCRSDALTTGAGLAVGLGLVPGQLPRRLARLGAFGAGLLLCALPYLVAMRAHAGEWRLSLKKEAGVLLRPPTAASAPPPAPGAALTLAQQVRLEELGGDRRALAPVWGYPAGESAGFAARKLLGAAHPLAAALALTGALLSLRATGRPRALLALPLLALLGGWAGQTLLRANFGYTGRIHASFAGVLVAPLAGVGLVLACQRLAAWRGWPARPLRTAALLGAALALLPGALEPQRAGRGEEAPVGRALRQRAGPGPLLICGRDARPCAWFAGAGYLDIPPGPPAQALAAARAAGARFLLVHLRWFGQRPGELEQALSEAGLGPPVLERTCREGAQGVRYGWLAWDLRPPPAGRR